MQDENILPPQFQAALERVRAGADTMPRRQLEGVLAAELGANWRSRFAHFEDVARTDPESGTTPLLAAAVCGHTDTVHLLLDANADVDKAMARTDNGATPLYIAALRGHTDIVRLLLDAKADVD